MAGTFSFRTMVSSLLVVFLFVVSFLSATNAQSEPSCVCDVRPRPSFEDHVESARWMVHTLTWGVLTTVSSRFQLVDQTFVEHSGDAAAKAVPFGNIYSFVDGSCENSTGIPYFYGTNMDQSFIDAMSNNAVSLTLSEAELPTSCGGTTLSSCEIRPTGYGDPENPPCARLTLSGTLEVLKEDSPEFNSARDALFQRHPSMAGWPQNHHWLVAKINIQNLWFIDFYGGANNLNVNDYLNYNNDNEGQQSVPADEKD